MSATAGLRVTISAKVTDDEAAIIEHARGGIPRSEFVRQAVLAAAGVRNCEHPGCDKFFLHGKDGAPRRFCDLHRSPAWSKRRKMAG